MWVVSKSAHPTVLLGPTSPQVVSKGAGEVEMGKWATMFTGNGCRRANDTLGNADGSQEARLEYDLSGFNFHL